MTVRTAGQQEPVLRREIDTGLPIRGAVSGVIRLYPSETRIDEGTKIWVVAVQPRMRENRYPAAVTDLPNGVSGVGISDGEVSPSAHGEEAVIQILPIAVDSAGAYHRLEEMLLVHDLTRSGERQEIRPFDRISQSPDDLERFPRGLISPHSDMTAERFYVLVMGIEEVSEDVHLTPPSRIKRGYLDAGYHLYAVRPSHAQGFILSSQGIMVGDAQSFRSAGEYTGDYQPQRFG